MDREALGQYEISVKVEEVPKRRKKRQIINGK